MKICTKNIKCMIIPDDIAKSLKEIQPTGKREGFATIPEISWEDIGALEDLKKELTNNIILPIL
jgi:ribosome biogenesis ATPase